MVTKQFCDVCDSENGPYWIITIDIDTIKTISNLELCTPCKEKFNKIIEKFKDGN